MSYISSSSSSINNSIQAQGKKKERKKKVTPIILGIKMSIQTCTKYCTIGTKLCKNSKNRISEAKILRSNKLK